MVKLSAIQLCSTPDVDQNLAVIHHLLLQLDKAPEHIVVLPECCLFFGGEEKQQLELAQQTQQNNYLQNKLADLARQHQIYLVAGTIPLLWRSKFRGNKNANDVNKFTNASCVFSPSGELLSTYHKIHLFDVDVNDQTKSYFESNYTHAGSSLSIVNTGFANIGLSVCYDLRFPELYRALRTQGADIITVPSAFTFQTGKSHWQALLQARAIENQCYIIAAGQQGLHKNGRETWGHSMIVSPWGEILSCIPEQPGIISVEYKPEEISRIRTMMPVQEHNQFTTELIHEKR